MSEKLSELLLAINPDANPTVYDSQLKQVQDLFAALEQELEEAQSLYEHCRRRKYVIDDVIKERSPERIESWPESRPEEIVEYIRADIYDAMEEANIMLDDDNVDLQDELQALRARLEAWQSRCAYAEKHIRERSEDDGDGLTDWRNYVNGRPDTPPQPETP